MDFIKIKHFCCLRFYLFIEHGAGEGQHERERENLKADSALSVEPDAGPNLMTPIS